MPGYRPGECVRLPDGRIGRLRDFAAGRWRVRVRRTTSRTHQFARLPASDLEPVPCPRGWMSPAGYERYLAATLEKMRRRAGETDRTVLPAPTVGPDD